MRETLHLLRYNTGSDKKAFIEFKNDFDAVIFNASIVAYSGASIADLVSIHMNKYIIDPQTYILQHDNSAFLSKSGKIKASILKYLDELPREIRSILVEERRALTIEDISRSLNQLVTSVYDFQVKYIERFLEKKDYNKYLSFALEEEEGTNGYSPKLIIAPYFRLKNEYSIEDINRWNNLNATALRFFLENYSGLEFPIAAEIVLDKKVLCNLDFEQLKNVYDVSGYEYIFVWIDNFSPLSANKEEQRAFKRLLKMFNSIGKCPIMSYGGYDSIMLCHKSLGDRLFGVAQSVGYGEARAITPVGGGIPVNKYYYYPTHQRKTFGDVSTLLTDKGFFKGDKADAARRFFESICNCPQCVEIIKNNIDNFQRYNESVPYDWKGDIKRNRPTTEASFLATRHFMWCKKREWETIEELELSECLAAFVSDCESYGTTMDKERAERFIYTYAK